MLALKHIGAATIAAVIATAMVIDSADARRGGGGARASGGGARVANTGAFARAWHPTTGRLGFGRPGWSAAALGAVAVGTGLAYAGSNYCDPYASYGSCSYGAYANYGPYANYGSYAPPTYGANYGSIVPASPSYGSYANGTFGSLGVNRPTYQAAYAQAAYSAAVDAKAECARRFRSYDPASQTYLSYGGQRVPCP